MTAETFVAVMSVAVMMMRFAFADRHHASVGDFAHGVLEPPRRNVILSEESGSQSEALLQSKDRASADIGVAASGCSARSAR